LRRPGVGARDEAEEGREPDDGDDGVSQLGGEGDAVDDLLEEALAIAQERREKLPVGGDRLGMLGHCGSPLVCCFVYFDTV